MLSNVNMLAAAVVVLDAINEKNMRIKALETRLLAVHNELSKFGTCPCSPAEINKILNMLEENDDER